MKELLSIVINYRTENLLNNFIESYMKYVDSPDRTLVVGDVASNNMSSTINLPDGVGFYGWVDNIGYAKAVNQITDMYKDHKYKNIAIFNADTMFVNSECVDSCLSLLNSDDKIAIVGPLQYDSYGRVTHAGIIGTNSKPIHRSWHSKNLSDLSYVSESISVSGSAFFIKRSIWDELANDKQYKEIDPDSRGAFLNTDLYYEETWCCYFARHKGYKVMYNGEASMIHEWDSSPNSELTSKIKESREMFRKACDHIGIEHE